MVVPWSDKDDDYLLRLPIDEISMAGTYLGRQEVTARRELIITCANMTYEEWSKLCSKREERSMRDVSVE